MEPEVLRNPFLDENTTPFPQPVNQYIHGSNGEKLSIEQDYYSCPFPLKTNNQTLNLPEPDLEAFKKLKADNLLAKSKQSQQQFQFQQSQMQSNNQPFQGISASDTFPKQVNSLFPSQNSQQPQNGFPLFNNNSALFPNSTGNASTFNLFEVGNHKNSAKNVSLFSDTPAVLPQNLAPQSFSLFSFPVNSSPFRISNLDQF